MKNLHLGQKMREIRKVRGLTLAEVAGEEFTKGYISQVELGRVEPSFKLLSHISGKLGVNIEQLISSEEKLDSVLAVMESEFLCNRYKKVIELGKDVDNTFSDSITTKVKLLQLKAFYYLNRYEESIELAGEILKLSDSWSVSYRLEAYSFMGVSMFSKGLYTEVIDLYNEAFKFAKMNDLNSSKLLANMYLNRATAFQNLKDYKKAVTFYDETLDFAKKHECMETVLDAFLRIGFCHYKLGDYDLAKSFIFDGFRINKVLDSKLPQAEAYLLLSYILIEDNNYKAAETLLVKALVLFREVSGLEGTVETLFVLSNVYSETGKNKVGKKYLLECYKAIETSDVNIFEHSLVTDVAKLCMAYELHEEASQLFSKLVK